MSDVRHRPLLDGSCCDVLLFNECAEEREATIRHLTGVGIYAFAAKPLAVPVVQVHLVLDDVVPPLELSLRQVVGALEGPSQKRVVAGAMFWLAVTKHEDSVVDSVYRILW